MAATPPMPELSTSFQRVAKVGRSKLFNPNRQPLQQMATNTLPAKSDEATKPADWINAMAAQAGAGDEDLTMGTNDYVARMFGNKAKATNKDDDWMTAMAAAADDEDVTMGISNHVQKKFGKPAAKKKKLQSKTMQLDIDWMSEMAEQVAAGDVDSTMAAIAKISRMERAATQPLPKVIVPDADWMSEMAAQAGDDDSTMGAIAKVSKMEQAAAQPKVIVADDDWMTAMAAQAGDDDSTMGALAKVSRMERVATCAAGAAGEGYESAASPIEVTDWLTASRLLTQGRSLHLTPDHSHS